MASILELRRLLAGQDLNDLGCRMEKLTGRKRLLVRALIVLALLFCSNLLPAQDLRSSVIPEAQFTAGGTQSCLRCHAGEAMQVMAKTAHGDAANPHTPYATRGCESCHGPGSLHVSRARGGAGFPALLAFDRKKNTGTEMNAACTQCHEKVLGELPAMEWAGSVHAEIGITCVSCHNAMHSLEQPLSERAGQLKNCSRCHGPAVDAHPRFENKGIVFDRLSCTDCHDVHQLIGAE